MRAGLCKERHPPEKYQVRRHIGPLRPKGSKSKNMHGHRCAKHGVCFAHRSTPDIAAFNIDVWDKGGGVGVCSTNTLMIMICILLIIGLVGRWCIYDAMHHMKHEQSMPTQYQHLQDTHVFDAALFYATLCFLL